MKNYSLVQIIGEETEGSKCSYCDSPDKSRLYGMWADCITCEDFEDLLNQGWSRSGKYLYKPTNNSTCCPSYTISCRALNFKISKSQKKVLRKFKAHLMRQSENNQDETDESRSTTEQNQQGDFNRHFEVKTVSVNSTEFEQTFDQELSLYRKYQIGVHGKDESQCGELQFRRFLCDSPLNDEKTDEGDVDLGTFHQQYYIDNELIAVGVLDILPSCVVSCFFFYSPHLRHLCLGHFGALKEIDYVRELNARCPSIKYYYMGYYIQNCGKMNYKAGFHPSYLLCSEKFTWHLLDEAVQNKLKSCSYSRLSSPDDGDDEKISGFSSLNLMDDADLLNGIWIAHDEGCMLYLDYRVSKKYKSKEEEEEEVAKLQNFARTVGRFCATSILVYLGSSCSDETEDCDTRKDTNNSEDL